MPATLTTLTSFHRLNGSAPNGILIDASGNLFGTIAGNGPNGPSSLGTVLKITKTSGVYSSSPTVVASFNDGAPVGGLVADASGNLFGTIPTGGPEGKGVIFEIANINGVYSSSPTVLASLRLFNGAYPVGLMIDASGNLFGTAMTGGDSGDGTVFEIAKTSGVYNSTPTMLASFNGSNGADPEGGLVADASGNLFGTTRQGGAYRYGAIFEIAKTNGVYGTSTVLASFNTSNGVSPTGGLVADASGNLFGTTGYGGAYGFGTVFEIAKTNGVFSNTPTVLASFDSSNGANPEGRLLADAAGNLFGTTSRGIDANSPGAVFEITKTNGIYSSTPTVLASFEISNSGAYPFSGLVVDAAGNLFGSTSTGGVNGGGTVFELSGSGFVLPSGGAPVVTEILTTDTGSSSTDRITRTVSLSGTGDANATVTFFDLSAGFIGATTADASGAWTYTPSGLADGYHLIVARETDAAGNLGQASLGFDLDTLAPRFFTERLASDTGASARDRITSVATLTGGGDANATVTLFEGSSYLGATKADANGTWTYKPLLGDGYHSIVARETDAAGNIASVSLGFSLDTLAPRFLTERLVTDTGTSNTDKLTSDPTVAGSGDAKTLVTLTEGSGVLGGAVSDQNGNWVFKPTLEDGYHTVVASETDLAGNTGSVSLAFTLDRTGSTSGAGTSAFA